jgi:hypothetical protein
MTIHPEGPSGDGGFLELVAIPANRVMRFFFRATMYTRPEDIPHKEEWEAWLSRFDSLEEAWDTCRDPELLLFLHHSSSAASKDWDATCTTWRRFASNCLQSAALGEADFRSEASTDYEEDFFAWFSHGSSLPVAEARRAVRHALAARVREGESRRAVLGELASDLKTLVDNPFIDSEEASDSQTFWRVRE